MTPAPERSRAQLRNHYEVERALAGQLKAASTPAERARIYATMYDELFACVPDHPRLTANRDLQAEQRHVQRLVHLLRPHLERDTEYVEFGAGTCVLTCEVARYVRRARAVEIAAQIPADVEMPPNFALVLYDGWTLDLGEGSVDLVFSEQFLEHLHPDDARHHLEIVHRMLRPGGRYVLRTPERWTGPHDISRWFSAEPQGFHLREWSYKEVAAEARAAGFGHVHAYWNGRGQRLALPLGLVCAVEAGIARLPRGMRRTLGHRLIPMVTVALEK